MTAPSVSVIIASYDRPGELSLCLKALSFQYHKNFEVVVVCNSKSAAALAVHQRLAHVKHARLDEANISRARNLGIGLAAGDIVAFIDDDAIAEPTWLERLTAPFSDPTVGASGGFVRGRNGISYQWKANLVDPFGEDQPLDIEKTTILDPPRSGAIKTQGTNCAFRRSVLVELGGFDENYRFFLDETDLNIRLAQKGHRTAIVPGAEVQHGFAAGPHRTKNRAPKSLFEIGASKAYLLSKYGADLNRLAAFARSQRARLLRLMVAGEIEPRDVSRLSQTLADGFNAGTQRIQKNTSIATPPLFLLFATTAQEGDSVFITGRQYVASRLRKTASACARDGAPVTLLLFTPSVARHKRHFSSMGYWVQTGGIYGKSHRDRAFFTWYRFSDRVENEIAELRDIRGGAVNNRNEAK